MAQQIQVYSITAPGFYGLNTQDSSLDLSSGFALIANNCILDQYGRIGSRKGWVPQNSSNVALGTADVKAMGELITDDGFQYILAAGDNKLFRLNAGALTEITYGGGGVAPTITDSNWKIAVLNKCMYFFQIGHDPLVYEPGVSATTYRRVSEKSGYAGTVPKADEVISAYGRLWAVSTTTDKVTIYFSDLLGGHVWTTGTAGSLDVSTVWPKGGDAVVGLGAHNGFLYIFGRQSILVYQNATTPASMSLYDSVAGIGCIARDTIKSTGTDIIFLSDTGVRSIQRTIQEKSAPHRDLSKNIRNDLMANVASEGNQSRIKAVYSPFESFYLLSLPTLKMVYCFDMKQVLQDGSSRVTTWDGIQPKSFLYCRDESLLIGKEGFVGKYSGYQDNTSSYRMQYFTNHTDLGAPSVTSVLKKITVSVIGGSNQYVTLKWGYDFSGNYQAANIKIAPKGIAFFGTSEYNVAEYTGGTNLEALVAYPTGSGKVVQTGYEADINGSSLSIQKLELQAKNGKVV